MASERISEVEVTRMKIYAVLKFGMDKYL